MPKKFGIICLIAGTVLIFSALSLLWHNHQEEVAAKQVTESLFADMQQIIAHNRVVEDEPINEDEPLDEEEPLKEVVNYIDGYEYIGFLSIPDLGLALPVMSQWDYDRLKIAPCRQFGSIAENNLVIAAHNYKSHFAYLKNLTVGGKISITDMNGEEYFYEIMKMGTVDPTAVEEVQNSGYDLVLYTCTMSKKARVTVFCNKTNTDK